MFNIKPVNIKLLFILILIFFFTSFTLGNDQDHPSNKAEHNTSIQSQKETDCHRGLILNPEKYYTFSLRLIEDSLFSITIDLQSPPLRRWMKRVVDIMEEYTGITPETARQTELFSSTDHKEVFLDTLLEQVLLILMSNRKKSSPPKLASLDLGVILDQQHTLGCLELSLFFSIFLAEYGIPNMLIFSGYHHPSDTNVPYFPPCLSLQLIWNSPSGLSFGISDFHQNQGQAELVPINRVLGTKLPIRHIRYTITQPEK